MYVFVYGTLTDPGRVESVVGDGRYEFDGPATLEDSTASRAIPDARPGGSVDGRLLDVDDAALERLDRYEGVDTGLYVRLGVPSLTATRRFRCTSVGRIGWVSVSESSGPTEPLSLCASGRHSSGRTVWYTGANDDRRSAV